jgi:hypothetical protein
LDETKISLVNISTKDANMAERASARLAAKKAKEEVEAGTRKKGKSMSVGGALGLTPRKPKGGNLQVAIAVDAAKAAAARLDGFSEAEQRGITKRKKRDKSKKTQERRASYHPSSRESMTLM